MSKKSPNLQGVPETMLQTVYARARETRTGRNFVNDPKAVEIVSQLDYDFSSARKDRAMCTGVVARTILLDRMVRDFLQAHPNTVVLNLACGLDTRCYRMAGGYARWYNLDLPETMAVRRMFFTPTDQIRQIPCSALEEGWTDQVSLSGEPVLILIEGLSMYLEEDQIRQLLELLSRHYPQATLFLEVMNPWVVKHMKEKSIEGSGAAFRWGIQKGSQLSELVPTLLCREEHSLTEGMQVFLPIYRLLGKIPCIRSISNRLLVLTFQKGDSL